MEELLKAWILGSEGLFAYGVVFGILLACGLGLPLPEDVTLILGGYLVHAGAADLWWMLITGYLGIAVGDSLIFFAGRRLGRSLDSGAGAGGFWSRLITPDKRAKVHDLYSKHGPKVVMAARFLPGLRAVAFFTAGSTGMAYRQFLLFDSVAALASAPLFVLLGWRYGGEMDLLIQRLKQGQLSAFALIGAVLVVWGAVWLWKRRRARVGAPSSTS
jgi:membrane protein DedA with SNARE-associated domain